MIDAGRLIRGIDDYISARFNKAGIMLERIADESSFNFWYLEAGYKLSFYEDEQKKANFSMKVSDLEGIFHGVKECIEENGRSNSEIGKTRYLNKREVSERGAGAGLVIEIKCGIKTIPSFDRENDEKTFYNTLWAYIIQPTMRCVQEFAQKCNQAQKRKCA